ncbi:MAG: GNAT family N-acetyltransferase, partial [Candidatus Hodarchaeota archaeon]
ILLKDLELIQFWFNHPSLRGKVYLNENINPWLALTEDQMKTVYEKWTKRERETHLMVETIENHTPIGLAMWDVQWDPHCPGIDLFIAPDHHRLGYGAETLQLLLEYLFGHTPAHSVSVWISELTPERLGFFKKYGFQDQGKLRRASIIDGRDIGIHVLDLLKREWLAQQQANG